MITASSGPKSVDGGDPVMSSSFRCIANTVMPSGTAALTPSPTTGDVSAIVSQSIVMPSANIVSSSSDSTGWKYARTSQWLTPENCLMRLWIRLLSVSTISGGQPDVAKTRHR